MYNCQFIRDTFDFDCSFIRLCWTISTHNSIVSKIQFIVCPVVIGKLIKETSIKPHFLCLRISAVLSINL